MRGATGQSGDCTHQSLESMIMSPEEIREEIYGLNNVTIELFNSKTLLMKDHA